jgi:hypothetical protein
MRDRTERHRIQVQEAVDYWLDLDGPVKTYPFEDWMLDEGRSEVSAIIYEPQRWPSHRVGRVVRKREWWFAPRDAYDPVDNPSIDTTGCAFCHGNPAPVWDPDGAGELMVALCAPCHHCIISESADRGVSPAVLLNRVRQHERAMGLLRQIVSAADNGPERGRAATVTVDQDTLLAIERLLESRTPL